MSILKCSGKRQGLKRYWHRLRGESVSMETLIGLIVFGLIIGIPLYKREHTFNNRTSPPGYKTDYGAMNHDLTMGMSKDAVKDKFNRGGYDIPDKH